MTDVKVEGANPPADESDDDKEAEGEKRDEAAIEEDAVEPK